MLFFVVRTEQDKVRRGFFLSSMTGQDNNMACKRAVEYKPNLFAYSALARHLSGCVIVVILALFLLQVRKIRT